MERPIIAIQGGLFRIRIPATQRNLAGRAKHLRWAIWNAAEGTWDFPMCRECYANLLDALDFTHSDFPNFQVRALPSYVKWLISRRGRAKRLLHVGSTVLLQPRGSDEFTVMCVIKDASLATDGQLRYRLRDQAGNELWACASSMIRIGDPVTFARSAQQNVGEQLEVSWILEGSSLRHETAKTDVGLILGEAENELIAYFAANRERLQSIEPRVFEKLVLAVYRNHGFDVTPIGAWNQKDGGVDIIAVYKSVGISELRLAIQCKCSRNKISAEPIRALAGVLDRFKAHQGVLCTTSHFTADAVSERDHLWRVTLEDRDKIYLKLRTLKF